MDVGSTRRLRTRFIVGTHNPQWNEQHEVYVADEAEQITLEVKVSGATAASNCSKVHLCCGPSVASSCDAHSWKVLSGGILMTARGTAAACACHRLNVQGFRLVAPSAARAGKSHKGAPHSFQLSAVMVEPLLTNFTCMSMKCIAMTLLLVLAGC
jgi:hypothetical protein